LKEESKFKATISFIISPSYSTAGSLREREREREKEKERKLLKSTPLASRKKSTPLLIKENRAHLNQITSPSQPDINQRKKLFDI